jgi:hypothetical protein
MKENYDVVEKFNALVHEALRIGHEKIGMGLIRDQYRWLVPGKIKSDGFKFRNDLSPYIARHLFYLNPLWQKVITWRRVVDELDGENPIPITYEEIRNAKAGE